MSSTIIPIFRPKQPDGVKCDLPEQLENLFSRIIRDPTAPHRPARETRCTEMLCALLLNCKELKLHLFVQLAKLCGWSDIPFSEMEFDIETEQAVGSKRDDLRIEGFIKSKNERRCILLWTIEIKVQAGIHDSSYEEYGESENTELTKKDVPQIENYDRWLQTQKVKHKAGLVISIPSSEQEVSELKLSEPWKCLRWTDLGLWIEEALNSEKLPPDEKMLGKHFLGFVWQHLWDPNEMTENKIGIDDLALIRAFAHPGLNCGKLIDKIVAPLSQVLKESEIKFKPEPKHQPNLFRRDTLRSVIHASLVDNEVVKPAPFLTLMVGIKRDNACVFIESSPASSWKRKTRAICQKKLADLKEKNSNWSLIEDEGTWKDIELLKPLTWLLVEEDQEAALKEFVRAGIEDLKATGIIEALQAIPQSSSE